MRYSSFITFVLIFLLSCTFRKETKDGYYTSKKALDSWPTTTWQYDTTEHSGQFKHVIDSFPGKYSVLIVKDGQIVFEYYQEPYAKDSLIHVNSCTKTLISMLFGIVFKEQFTHHENKAAMDYFPEYSIEDALYQNVKVRHLLSMSSGMKWRGGIDATDVIQMSETDDWAKYVFEREIKHTPGEVFHYNSGGSQVISTILEKETENGLIAFAEESLFNPLGISEFVWDSTLNGVPKAGWGLRLKIEDLARLGYLLLKKGKWEDLQIIPEDWVSTMSSKHITANATYDYGYQVWIPKHIGTSCFLLRGSYPPSTKIVAVLPELNSVVVYVGENYNTNDLLRYFIVPVLRISSSSKVQVK